MKDTHQEEINLEPLILFFKEEISPSHLAQILDKAIFDYLGSLIQLINKGENCIHEETFQYYYYLRMLRDVLQECK